MALNVKDIASVIKKQLLNYDVQLATNEEGSVVTVGDGIALVDGLENVMMGELLLFDGDIYGLVLNLEEGIVGVVLLGDDTAIKEGSIVKRTKKIIETGVGDAFKGRVVSAIGEPLDGQGPIKASSYRAVERIAPGVMTRKSVDQPLETGLIPIDAMIPIGKGQRELIIGDRQTGKTTIALDTILNQKGKNVACIYVAIGQKASTVAQVVEKLKTHNALNYTTVVTASASEPAPLQYLAPYTGITIAEAWMEQGEDVLIIYDDLSKHAIAYRTIALLLRRSPGREAYPGDVFYLHSRLLERACRLNEEYQGGSITALPIVEVQAGDISAYIPTNVISSTDGQIFLNTDQFNKGLRPAVDVGFSVSRVGSAAQQKYMKQVAGSLKLELAQFRELQAFVQFASDLDEATKAILEHGNRVLEILKQKQNAPLAQIDQALILLAVQAKLTQWIPLEEIFEYKSKIVAAFKANKTSQKVRATIEQKGEFDETTRKEALRILAKATVAFTKQLTNYHHSDYGSDEAWELIN